MVSVSNVDRLALRGCYKACAILLRASHLHRPATNMKCTVLLLLGLAAMVAARPTSVFNIDLEDIHHDLDIDDDTYVTGTYSWTSPEGVEYYVKYIADDDGYRVLESNAVPVSADGVKANGAQGSFVSFEEFDDDRK